MPENGFRFEFLVGNQVPRFHHCFCVCLGEPLEIIRHFLDPRVPFWVPRVYFWKPKAIIWDSRTNNRTQGHTFVDPKAQFLTVGHTLRTIRHNIGTLEITLRTVGCILGTQGYTLGAKGHSLGETRVQTEGTLWGSKCIL